MMTMDKPSWAKALQPKGVYLSKELGIHAKPSNRAFHPTTVDARNHNNIIWTAKEGTGTELNWTKRMCNAKSKLEAPIHPSSLGLKNEKGSPPETICEGQPTGFLKLGSYAGTLQRKQCNRRQQCQELCRDTTEETVQQETTVSGAMPGHYRGNSATEDNSVRSYAGTLQI